MRVRNSLFVLAVFVAMLPEPSLSRPLADTIDSVRPAIVGVGTARPVRSPLARRAPVRLLGTGFAVGDGLQAMTNHHVLPEELDLAGGETIVVFVGRGEKPELRPARVVARDSDHDLALLAFDGEPLPVLTLDSSVSVREGDAVAFTGFPIGAVLGLYPVTHRGIVSVISPTVIPASSSGRLSAAQVKRLRAPFEVYQLDATAYPGNSGSPVYRQSDGVVIGVMNSVLVKETKESVLAEPSGISYAIPVRFAEALLRGAVDRD